MNGPMPVEAYAGQLIDGWLATGQNYGKMLMF